MIHFEDALSIALQAHATQVDKEGEPYILHVLRVTLKMPRDHDRRVVALLHDVVEDTAWTLEDLAFAGLTPVQLAAVDAITRRKGEPYREYVERCMRDPIARDVKIADHDDNTDTERMSHLSPGDYARLKMKYDSVADLIAQARTARHATSGGTR